MNFSGDLFVFNEKSFLCETQKMHFKIYKKQGNIQLLESENGRLLALLRNTCKFTYHTSLFLLSSTGKGAHWCYNFLNERTLFVLKSFLKLFVLTFLSYKIMVLHAFQILLRSHAETSLYVMTVIVVIITHRINSC